jgi:DNA repair exonuclease SbcCD ATPase subunit
MELQQLEKRIEWLDDERRKDKNTIVQLRDRIIALEGNYKAVVQENKELQSEVTRLQAVTGRMDRIDDAISQNRVEFKQWINEQKARIGEQEEELKTLFRQELSGLEEVLTKTRTAIKDIPPLKEKLQAREQAENRISEAVGELAQTVDEIRVSLDDQDHSYRVIEDAQNRDSQRLTDLQGEITALRKRSDEYRGRFDVLDAEIRRTEARLNELLSVERERSENQKAFFEKQSAAETEREKTWKQWVNRFDAIEEQAAEIERYINSLRDTHLDVKRTQEMAEELHQKVERRINELTEMYRLSEERFRQEWNTFKADDQKRWTNYMLSHDEQQSEVNRRLERHAERLTLFEDNVQEIQDFLQEVNEVTWKRLHEVLEAFRDWTSDQERIQGQLG